MLVGCGVRRCELKTGDPSERIVTGLNRMGLTLGLVISGSGIPRTTGGSMSGRTDIVEHPSGPSRIGFQLNKTRSAAVRSRARQHRVQYVSVAGFDRDTTQSRRS